MRVLIADDDPLVCQSLKTILQADGSIEVIGIASDGIEAVELFAKLQPDVVLMDIRMPKMTGIEACERILKQFLDSEGTVRNYISAILDKLDLKDRTQLAIFYLRSVE